MKNLLSVFIITTLFTSCILLSGCDEQKPASKSVYLLSPLPASTVAVLMKKTSLPKQPLIAAPVPPTIKSAFSNKRSIPL